MGPSERELAAKRTELLLLLVDRPAMDRIQAFARDVTGGTGKLPDWLGYPLEWWAQLPGILGLAAFAWWRSGRAARAVETGGESCSPAIACGSPSSPSA